MDNRDKAEKKINDFFKTAIAYYGKEIALDSNQYFGIDQIVEEGSTNQRFQIQYGFPQSGCVVLNFAFEPANKTITLTDISVHAPKKNEQVIMANFSPEFQPLEELGIKASFGIDMKTEEHNTITAISNNPNALRIIEAATTDLEKAEVLGDCRLAVPMGSRHIPCTSTTPKRRINPTENIK